MASRGTSVNELLSSNWFTGPHFLWEKKIQLLTKETIGLTVGDPEVRKVQTLSTETVEHTSLSDRLTRFSSWSCAVSAIARLRRYLLKDKSKTLTTVTERQNTEMVIIKDLQRQAYQNEIETLNKGKQLPENNKMFSWTRTMCLRWEEGSITHLFPAHLNIQQSFPENITSQN